MPKSKKPQSQSQKIRFLIMEIAKAEDSTLTDKDLQAFYYCETQKIIDDLRLKLDNIVNGYDNLIGENG